MKNQITMFRIKGLEINGQIRDIEMTVLEASKLLQISVDEYQRYSYKYIDRLVDTITKKAYYQEI